MNFVHRYEWRSGRLEAPVCEIAPDLHGQGTGNREQGTDAAVRFPSQDGEGDKNNKSSVRYTAA